MIQKTDALKAALDDLRHAYALIEASGGCSALFRACLKIAAGLIKKELELEARNLETAKAEKGTKENAGRQPEPARG